MRMSLSLLLLHCNVIAGDVDMCERNQHICIAKMVKFCLNRYATKWNEMS